MRGISALSFLFIVLGCGARDTLPIGESASIGGDEPGPMDAGPMDAGPMDAGPMDAGPVEPGDPCADSENVEKGAPWPMWSRCATHPGRSHLRGPASPAILWVYPTKGNVYSSPAVGANGTIYITSRDHGL